MVKRQSLTGPRIHRDRYELQWNYLPPRFRQALRSNPELYDFYTIIDSKITVGMSRDAFLRDLELVERVLKACPDLNTNDLVQILVQHPNGLMLFLDFCVAPNPYGECEDEKGYVVGLTMDLAPCHAKRTGQERC